jgi:hypothetical protein
MKMITAICIFFLMAVFVFLSCKKDKVPDSSNQPPVANAGPDQLFTLSSCSEKAKFNLDGSGSTDPNNKIIGYYWREVSALPGFTIYSNNTAKPSVEITWPGEYVFELTVTDENYSSSKDIVLITVKGTPKEFDLDVTFNATYNFTDNYYDYYGCFYYGICRPTDRTEIIGTGTFSPFGILSVYFFEEADSASLNYAPNSIINISQDQGNFNTLSIIGNSTVNLKKLRQQGGGPFTGTIKVTDGSVTRCAPDVLTNLPPLNITGRIDTATGKATVTVKGKMYL